VIGVVAGLATVAAVIGVVVVLATVTGRDRRGGRGVQRGHCDGRYGHVIIALDLLRILFQLSVTKY
jgi:hypothetical protein